MMLLYDEVKYSLICGKCVLLLFFLPFRSNVAQMTLESQGGMSMLSPSH